MAIELIAELATAHGGDIDLAKRMIDAAAAAGADAVKTQAYLPASVSPHDPQSAWLVQSALRYEQHYELKRHAKSAGVRYFASAFDAKSAAMCVDTFGLVKIPSTEAFGGWWAAWHEEAWVSFGWKVDINTFVAKRLVTVPLYPTPLEAISRVDFAGADGYSDHCEGLSAALFAATKVDIIEVHFTIPGARQRSWDKSPEDIRRLKDWMLECQVVRTGVSRTFRERWVR